MKPARRKRWLIPFLLLSLAAVDPAYCESICGQWRNAGAMVHDLENAGKQLSARRDLLKKKVEEGRSRAAAQPGSEAKIRQMEEDARQKAFDKKRVENELAVDRREAARQDPSRRRAEAEEAKRKLRGDREKLARVEADIQSRLGNDPKLADLRKERDSLQGEHRNLFGNQTPDDTLAFLRTNPHGCNRDLQKTDLCEYAKAIGRREHFSDQTASTPFGIGLDDRNKWPDVRSLVDGEARERARLAELASRLIKRNAEIAEAEKLAAGPALLQERDGLRSSIARAESTSAQSQENLSSDERYFKTLQERIEQEENELAALARELEDLERDLARRKADRASLQAAEAELGRVESDLERINEGLDAARQERDGREKELHSRAALLGALTAQGGDLYNQAVGARKENNAAACERYLKGARDTLADATRRSAEIESCLDPSVLKKLTLGRLQADAVDCRTGSPPAGMVKMPAVRGMDWKKAEELLTSLGFRAIRFSELLAPAKESDKGRAISTSPPAGQAVPPETPVTVFLFNKNFEEPEKAKERVQATLTGGGDWDKEAGKARVSAVTVNAQAPAAPAGGTSPPDGIQTDRAKEVANEAIARGPKAEPVITHEGIAGVMGTVAGIAASRDVRGKTTGYPTSQPGIRDIGQDPLPGVIPSTKTAPGRAAVPAGNAGAGKSADQTMKCAYHKQGNAGDAYYVVETPGSPKGYIIHKVWDPPRGDADRMMCGTQRGAMKKCLQGTYGPSVVVLGPFSGEDLAMQTAKGRCR
ncbi:MAG: PASTA domain-containing protein [Thermodesulfobacteriota bacterium]